jgi:acetoin utilization protein AcuC
MSAGNLPATPESGLVEPERPAGHEGQPLVIYGPWSLRYDFGPSHPLTPRRFGPGISLLEASGATRFEAPEPAPDDELRLIHPTAYIEMVKSAGRGADPDRITDRVSAHRAGLGPGDNPIFPGMHEAAAAVAGGSLAAMRHLLDGSETHAFHPGGGLHHAMADRASGFCIYNDPALAIALARRADLRVLYVDLDVHHGDGVQAAFWDDPEVMTISLHESGRYLFPGTGSIDEVGGGDARGTKVNMPFEPGTSDGDWLAALERLVPPLAERLRPDVLVSQHGADSHAFDPLAHLMLTTRAMQHAARLLDVLAHEYCGGRWLATGGGGYDIHRVVPRSWAIVWSAQVHVEPDDMLPQAWRARWADDADRAGQSPIPERLLDPESLVSAHEWLTRINGETLERLASAVLSPMDET